MELAAYLADPPYVYEILNWSAIFSMEKDYQLIVGTTKTLEQYIFLINTSF